MTKTEKYSSVTKIDFAQWRKEGIECVIFDIEGTIAVWGTESVPDDIKRHIKRSKIKKIGIATNLNIKHKEKVANFANQIGAKSYQLPRFRAERKPKGRMLRSCIRELGSTHEKTAMVGDKLLDIMAAKSADVNRVAWIDRYGDQDHWFDKLIYRHLEPIIKKLVK